MPGVNCIFWTLQDCYTHELIATVAICIKPVQYQGSMNSIMEVRKTHQPPFQTNELLPVNGFCWEEKSVVFKALQWKVNQPSLEEDQWILILSLLLFIQFRTP